MTPVGTGFGRARLNPFAFVSDTGLRFALLVVLVVCASGQRWFSIAFNAFDLNTQIRTCVPGEHMISDALLHSNALQNVTLTCVLSITRAAVLPRVSVGLALLAAVTWLIYQAYPRWQIWRLRLERLDPDEAPELSAALDALCRTAGLRRKPEFWWNPLDGRTLALAFGTGRRRVALTGAVALQWYTDPAAFQAMLLHELAHIRNGDVGLAYLTLSIWWAFLTTALLPFAVVNLTTPQTAFDFAHTAAELGLFALCVLLTRNAVLRARELYADARSSSWQQDKAGLARVLGALAPIPRLRRLLSPHPAPSKRQRLIEDTDEMFRFGAWDAFGVGLSAGIAAISLMFPSVSLFSTAEAQPPLGVTKLLLGFVIPVLVVTPMASGVMAIGTWRAAFLALMRGRGYVPTLRVATACATGGVIGGIVPGTVALLLTAAGIGSGAGLMESIPIGLPMLALLGATACLLFIVALTLTLAAFLVWVEATARCWLAASLPGAAPGPTFIFGLTLCLIVATLWMIFVLPVVAALAVLMYKTGYFGLLSVLWYGVMATQLRLFGPIAWFGIIASWVFPLSAVLVPPRRTVASWAFLDAARADTSDLPTTPLRLRRAVLLGLVGGVIAVLAPSWLRLSLPTGSLHALGQSDSATIYFAIESSRLLPGVTAQGLVAVLAVLAIRRLAIPHAMCAAFVTGGLFAIGEMLDVHASRHGPVSFGFMGNIILPFVLFDGALVALICASVACLLAAPVRWLHARAQRNRTRLWTASPR